MQLIIKKLLLIKKI